MSAPVAQKALSSGGKVFFGSLCCGTFVLGVWQTQRYFEKDELMKARDEQLQMPPVTSIAQGIHGEMHGERFRKWRITGTFHHGGEVLVGPRGLPPGAIEKSKPRGVMGDSNSTGPQGYFVITPFSITEEDATSKSTRTVMVNRGWVPKAFVEQGSSATGLWSQPEGPVSILAIPTPIEEPKWIKPMHDFTKNPVRMLYYDVAVFKMILERLHPHMDRHHVTEEDDRVIVLTQIKDQASNDPNNNIDPRGKLVFPLQSPSDKVGEYKISPMIHAGYAFTWFGLSGAGVIMLRTMLTRGRG